MSIGERLRKIRGGLRQSEFAALVGSSQSGISAYEKGQRKPDYETLMRVSKIFGISLEWLLTGEGNMSPPVSSPQCVSIKEKTSDTLEVLKDETSQSIDFIDREERRSSNTLDISEKELAIRCLRLSDEKTALQRELLEVTRQNGDLRVEVERRDARIADLERQLMEALKARIGPTILDERGAAAG